VSPRPIKATFWSWRGGARRRGSSDNTFGCSYRHVTTVMQTTQRLNARLIIPYCHLIHLVLILLSRHHHGPPPHKYHKKLPTRSLSVRRQTSIPN
jgi:hypothetical protein